MITLNFALFCLLLCSFNIKAQIGINTLTPQATLDITGKPAVTTELDGVIPPRLTGAQLRAKTYTASQTAAIVYVTTADTAPAGQTINVTVPGHFYFDGTVWIALSPAGDGDFYKVGTTNPPTLITEDVWRTGNVAIGKISANAALDVVNSTATPVAQITSNGTFAGNSTGLTVTQSNSGTGVHFGIRTNVSYSGTTGNERHYGSYNQVNGTATGVNQNIGTYNATDIGAGQHTGTFNSLTGTENSNNTGTTNYITNRGNGEHIGTSNLLKSSVANVKTGTGKKIGNYTGINDSEGDNYGTYNEIFTTVAGKKSYGSYNDVNSNSGTNYAGFFDSHGTGGVYYAAVFNRGNVVANEAAGDYDFRIEGQTDPNLFFADASTNNVGIGTGTPTATNKLEVNGRVQATDFKLSALSTAAPTNSTTLGTGKLGEIRITSTNIYICVSETLSPYWKTVLLANF